MNTPPVLLSQLFQVYRNHGVLHTRDQILGRTFCKHGDLCFGGGFNANTLSTTSNNHDPQHDPYGICWSMAQESATEQPLPIKSAQTKDESATQQRSASSSGYATELLASISKTNGREAEFRYCTDTDMDGRSGRSGKL